MRCKECKYWDQLDNSNNYTGDVLGYCRINPPVYKNEEKEPYTGYWPLVYNCDWCGEWKSLTQSGNYPNII